MRDAPTLTYRLVEPAKDRGSARAWVLVILCGLLAGALSAYAWKAWQAQKQPAVIYLRGTVQ